VITQAEIEEVLGFPITSSTFANTDERPKAPGMKYRHYAPVAKIEIIENWNPEIIQKIQSFQGSTLYSV
jgi:L-threonylcarbamoyladenylate synthase